VRRKIAEAREKDGVVRLADMLKEREEAETLAQSEGDGAVPAQGGASEGPSASAGSPDFAAGEPAEELTPQVEEALNVLKDLVALTQHDA
jgi:hypothetical protein